MAQTLKAAAQRVGRTTTTPQSEPVLGETMVRNEAGGFTFPLSDADRFGRFLISGSETAYYADAPTLTRENTQAAARLFADPSMGQFALGVLTAISTSGRAQKVSPTLYALALALTVGHDATKQTAVAVVPQVVRTGSHLFEFVSYLRSMRGWGRAARRAVEAWYAAQTPEKLVYQGIKYRERNGWSHRDLLRARHVPFKDERMAAVAHYLVKGWPGVGEEPHPEEYLQRVWAYEYLKAHPTADVAHRMIHDYRLTREMIPNELLNDLGVWRALVDVGMPMTALVRNLGKMTSIGLLQDRDYVDLVAKRLGDARVLALARVHPMTLFSALKVYASGHGVRGSLSWQPVPDVVDALDAGVYLAMGEVPSHGKRVHWGVDVSGSMHGTQAVGFPHVTAHEAAAVMLLTSLKRDPTTTTMMSFSSGSGYGRVSGGRLSGGVFPLGLSANQRVDDAARTIQESGNGGTDCALPILSAMASGLDVDGIVIWTDGQTWEGSEHPFEAMERYRKQVDHPVKLASVAVASYGHDIIRSYAEAVGRGDPDDRDTLAVNGFDSGAATVLAEFLSGAADPNPVVDADDADGE